MSGLDVRRGIISGKLRPTIPDEVDPRFATLMRQCWRNDPKDRLPFVEAVKVLCDILGLNPSQSFYIPSESFSKEFLQSICLPQLVGAIQLEKESLVPFAPPILVVKKDKLRPHAITSMLAVGQRIWCGFSDGYVSIFDAASQLPVSAFSAFKDVEIFSMAATSDGYVWISSSSIKIYDSMVG